MYKPIYEVYLKIAFPNLTTTENIFSQKAENAAAPLDFSE